MPPKGEHCFSHQTKQLHYMHPPRLRRAFWLAVALDRSPCMQPELGLDHLHLHALFAMARANRQRAQHPTSRKALEVDTGSATKCGTSAAHAHRMPRLLAVLRRAAARTPRHQPGKPSQLLRLGHCRGFGRNCAASPVVAPCSSSRCLLRLGGNPQTASECPHQATSPRGSASGERARRICSYEERERGAAHGCPLERRR